MLKTTILQIFGSVVTCLLFSACTSVTPVLSGSSEKATATLILPATPAESRTAVATAQSRDSDQDCPPPSKTVDIAPQYYGRAAGNSPVWAIINKPKLVLSMAEIREGSLTEHGYPYKVLWVVEKNYHGKVVLQGGNVEDGNPLWFKIGGEQPTTTPTIDPLHPGAFSNPDYSDFPSYIFIQGTGCYFIEASWDQKNWRIHLLITE